MTRLAPGHHRYPGPDGVWRHYAPDEQVTLVHAPDDRLRTLQRGAVPDDAELVAALRERGILVAEPATETTAASVVHVLGGNPVADLTALLLEPHTKVVRGPLGGAPDMVVACAGWLPDQEWLAVDRWCGERGIAWHRCHAEGLRFHVGPCTVPYAEVRARRIAAARLPDELLAHWTYLEEGETPPVPWPSPGGSAVIAGLIVNDVLAVLAGHPAPGAGCQIAVEPDASGVTRHPVLPLTEAGGTGLVDARLGVITKVVREASAIPACVIYRHPRRRPARRPRDRPRPVRQRPRRLPAARRHSPRRTPRPGPSPSRLGALDMRVGLALGYHGEPMPEILPLVERADRAGVDSVWSVEEYGADGVTILAYLAARTERIKLGTGILQLAGRTPANTAMTALTLDILSEGRLLLGLGVSVPWIVEGWHGVPFGKPTRRLREYVEILRKAIACDERVTYDGEYYRLPYRGPGATGRARPVKALLDPVRTSIPTYLAAIGPANVRLAGEIADGWLPGFYSPEREAIMTAPLDEGLRRSGRESIDITVITHAIRTDDLGRARDELRPLYAAYIGPDLPGVRNTYHDLACGLGFEKEAQVIREHHREGRRADAVAAVPDALLDEVALLGPWARIRDRVEVWKESRVTTLALITRDAGLLEAVCEAAA
ncbi:hypothetical protein Aph01nite_10180 [Acrocarpospora phusangensis]|uniref:Luciferase-like domain-containing protein n=1 Tax=Acrocarpospora phusangensis TaxID=1070424 RepID=A0A919Q891_9ACTN|nr:LLM class F420-dependent oxidoreductase [Acrocarpospora phusangensis]GIH22708.1 hypothetical protein Aph01nite_10180 [Acrocarpospora phusangensis]